MREFRVKFFAYKFLFGDLVVLSQNLHFLFSQTLVFATTTNLDSLSLLLHSFTMTNQGFQGRYSWEQLLPQAQPQANVGSPSDELRKRSWSEESSVSVASIHTNNSSESNKRTKRSHPEDGSPCAFRPRYS